MSSTPLREETLAGIAEAMTAPITHRGPDDQGIWTEPTAALAFGFRRLAILDLSPRGHQPMRSPSGRYTLVFNGEVYNHDSLRRVLEREGWSFRGHSDTEVICAAFERWGIEAAVRQFIGMFAIAVWDAARRELSLVRDRLGIKPLFYCSRGGTFTFGSELKALVAGPDFDRSLDGDALEAYLRYLYVPAPQTIFRHVRKLLPGTILTVHTAGQALEEPRPYWSVDDIYRQGLEQGFEGSDTEVIEEANRLLSDAVRIRMQADVPLGALLSGGVDSSTVVALMQANTSRPTQTYSIGFAEEAYDEAPHAARVARYLGTAHTEMVVTESDALAVIPQLPELFDEPFADPSQIPTYLVCKLARKEVVVALSGDGGDEVFAGYHRYIQGERLISQLARVPRPVRRMAGALATAGGSRFWDRAYRGIEPLLPSSRRQRLPGEKIMKVGNLLLRDSQADMYRSLLSAWQRPGSLLLHPEGQHSRVEETLRHSGSLPLLDRMMLVDQSTYLADDLLAKVDRASMAVSLEARVPLLDHRVVEFGWRLPRHFKIRDGQGKWLLRQVLYRYVPRELVDRPKMGFSVPIGAWLRGSLRSWAEDLLFGSGTGLEPWLRTQHVRQAWSEFQRGSHDQALAIWAVLMFQCWRQQWAA
jgi:asparagine synthase (glutamine-hydrolysing)